MHHVLHEILRDALHHGTEHFIAFALPFGQRIFLTHSTKVDALLQIVHLFKMLAPTLINNAQHDLTFNIAHDC